MARHIHKDFRYELRRPDSIDQRTRRTLPEIAATFTRHNCDFAARVDIRVDRTFTVGAQPVNVFAGVQNATGRRNFAGYSWNRRTNTRQFGEQQGIFPILGLDWRF